MIWQMVPLGGLFLLHYTVRYEGAQLVPKLLSVKQQASQSGDRFAIMKVRQWLTLTSLRAGQLHQVHLESLEALHLLEQFGGHAMLAGDFSVSLACVLYEWNRLEEPRTLLRKVIGNVSA